MRKVLLLIAVALGLAPLFVSADVLYKSDFAGNPGGDKLVSNGVLAIRNLKAWNYREIFDDEYDGDYRFTVKYRFPGEINDGFMAVDFKSEEGTFKLIAHPKAINYNYTFLDKAKKSLSESAFGKAITPPEQPNDWQTIVITCRGGVFSAAYNGVELGKVTFKAGMLQKILLTGAYIDVEFQEAILESLPDAQE